MDRACKDYSGKGVLILDKLCVDGFDLNAIFKQYTGNMCILIICVYR